MRLESPGEDVPGRGPSPLVTVAVPGAARTPVLGAVLVVPTAAVAAAGLTVSATGSMLVAAVLVGVAARDRWSGLAAVLATTAVAVRFGTTDLGDLAGIQSVLGAAGLVGPPTAAASAWAAAGAVLLAVAPRPAGDGPGRDRPDQGEEDDPGAPSAPRLTAFALAVAGGSFAAALVAGPGPGGGPDGWPGGGIGLRVAASVVAIGLSLVVGRARRPSRLGTMRVAVAVLAGAAAVVLAGWPT